jgi:Cu-processing system permease protein
MDPRKLWIIARKELWDAGRNRWLLVYGAAFATLSLALSWLGASSVFASTLGGFGRTAASLIHLVLLLVPMIGLILGALALASERDRGTLACLLAQPVSLAEVLLGKFVGLSAALLVVLSLGFGASGAVIAWYGGGSQAGSYVALVALTFVLSIGALSLGLLVSAAARTTAAATGIALFCWLFLVALGDLGILASAITLKLGPAALLAAALVNPLQAFKLAAVLAVRGSAEILGPAGAYALARFGTVLLWPILTGILAAWVIVPLVAAGIVLRHRGAF